MLRRLHALIAPRLLPFALLAAALLALGCSSTVPPSRWSVGGAQLSIPWARWDAGEATVELRPDGTVLVDGEASFVLDAAGRVYDTELAPLAVLEPDGRLVGGDERPLGVVGSMHASLPGMPEAWLSVMPDGTVVRYGDEGDRFAGGVWQGCQGPPQVAQACVLVTHLVLLDAEMRRRQRSGPGFGFGIGVMVIR